MANDIQVIENGDKGQGALSTREAAFAKVAAKKLAQNPAQKKKSLKRRDDKIAALSVVQKAVFYYVNGDVRQIPISKKVATVIGLPLTDIAIMKVAGRRILGDKSVGKMKMKTIKVSYGFSFITKRKATRGKATGRARTKSVSSGLVRRYTTVRVPLNATNLDILNWIESAWKKIPQLVLIGQQEFRLRSAARAARDAKDPDGKALVVA